MNNAEFVHYLEKKVRTTIRKYSLINKNDKVMVAVSGGKDSTTVLSILMKLGYKVEAANADPAIGEYTETNLKNLSAFCKATAVPLHVFTFKEEFGGTLPDLLKKAKKKGLNHSSCMLCGILKRYLLNKKAREMGFDVVATGHNLDDEAQAFLMNVFRNDTKRALRSGPVAGAVRSERFVRRIKPLYHVTEEETLRYARIRRFPVNLAICPHSADAYRRKFINMLNGFEKDHPNVKYNIIRFHEQIKASARQAEGTIDTCTECDEPASSSLCKTCQVLAKLK